MNGVHAGTAADAVTGVRTARVAAHAKVNLTLHILAREASGYHGLETVFARLALADTVEVTVGVAGRRLALDGPTLPPAGLGPTERNLAWRAAEAYAATAGWPDGFALRVTKRIPVGGGLGGGSADAGAVLRALDALAPRPLGTARLLALAGTLGADVPFLTQPAPLALAWGRGDRMLALPPLPAAAVTLVTFADGVSTPAAYGAFAAARDAAAPDATPTAPTAPTARLLAADAFADWASVSALAANDFETVVPGLHAGVAAWLPVLRASAASLRASGQPAIGMLSGSGATCFLLRAAPGSGAAAAWTPAVPPAGAAALLVETETLAEPWAPPRIIEAAEGEAAGITATG